MRDSVVNGPHFLGQRDNFRCGPITLINLCKWQGYQATKHDLARYTWYCGCHPWHGTPVQNFGRIVRKSGYQMSYARFKRAIVSGQSAIILAHKRDSYWHYFFVPGIATRQSDGREGFLAVNFPLARNTLTLVSWQQMERLLRGSIVWTFKQGETMEFHHLRQRAVAGGTRARTLAANADGWSDWEFPVLKGYRLGCCDCNLVHDIDFRVLRVVKRHRDGRMEVQPVSSKGFRIEFRAKRNERCTSARRQWNRK